MTREEAVEILSRPKKMKNTPSEILEAHEMAIKALEQEPCEDCISREYLLAIATEEGAYDYVSAHEIANAPSVTPAPKMGHWIDREIYDADRWKCSECGRTEPYKENYCPNCGSYNGCGAKLSEIPTGSESEG